MIRNKGFTLVEILLGMAIIVILSSGSYVGFVRFNRVQNLNLTRDTLLNSLNEARSSAMSQVISTSNPPDGCKQPSTTRTFVGYQISFNSSGSPHYYLLQEVCSSGTTTFTPTVKRINLPTDVVFVSPVPSQVRFSIITGGVSPPVTTIIIRSGGAGGPARTVTVNASGVISSN